MSSPWVRFRAQVGRHTADEDRQFALSLRGILRSASSLGVRFELRWSSGATSALCLRLGGEHGVRWFRAAMLPAYGLGRWLPGAHDDAAPAAWLVGCSAGPPGNPRLEERGDFPVPDALYLGLRSLRRGIQVQFRVAPSPLDARPPALLVRPREPVVSEPFARHSPADEAEWRLRNRAESRRQEPRWRISVSIAAGASVAAPELHATAQLLSDTIRFAGGSGVRFRRPRPWDRAIPPVLDFSESELAALLPSPWSRSGWGEPRGPRMGGLYIGLDESGAPVELLVPPSEGRHLAILGETGSGKSSVLLRLARDALPHGAVLLFDPVGDTAQRLLELLPPSVRSRARWVAPGSESIAINALGCATASGPLALDAAERAAGELVTALREVRLARFPETSFWGPRIEEHLRRALLAAASSPGATLLDAHRLLAEGNDPFEGWGSVGRSAVHQFRAWSASRVEEGEGARRLLAEITGSATLRRMLCASPGQWDLEGLDRPGSLTVFTAEVATVGEDTARYLLGVYLALVWGRLLARRAPRKVFLLLDELQWFGNGSVANMARLGRRLNLHLAVVTQSLSSLSESLREPLRTNVADFLLFRGDPEEARDFSRWLPGVAPERLLALPRGHAVLLRGKGGNVEWVRTVAPRPPRPSRTSTMPASSDSGEVMHRDRGEPPPSAGPQPVAPARSSSWWAQAVPIEGGKFRIELRSLRERAGLSDAQIRELGGALRRAGELERAGGGGGARYWILSSLPDDPGAFAGSERSQGEAPDGSGTPISPGKD